MKWTELRKTINKNLTRLSAIMCQDCPKKSKCLDESKCEKHRLINEILRSLQ